MSRRLMFVVSSMAVSAALVLAGCSTSSTGDGGSNPTGSGSGSGRKVVQAAASINAWGSILSQLGGTHVKATSIITSPDTDPHDYEPTPADGRTIASAQLFVENGIGYDSWADKAVQANPDSGRTVINNGIPVAAVTETLSPAGASFQQWQSFQLKAIEAALAQATGK